MNKKTLVIVLLVLFVFVFLPVGLIVMGLLFGGGMPLSGPVAIVEITKPIFESDEVVKELADLESDQDVKVVVLRLDSPGGAVGPSQEIYDQVKKLDAKKPVIVSMGTVAASGAYYIASASRYIVANPGTITGSIGVIMETFGLKQILDKWGIESRVIKSGDFKDVGNPFKELTEQDRSYLKAITDDMYEQFVSAVAEGRKLDLEKAKELAQGKIYTGRQAKNLGLVDELGNYLQAVDRAKEIAGLGKDAKVRWPKDPSALEEFLGAESQANLYLTIKSKLFGQRVPVWLMPDFLVTGQ